jgi:hypothetical protein
VWSRPKEGHRGETPKQRRERPDRQSRHWSQAVAEIGPPPAGSHWVYVGDAENDIYEFMVQTRATGVDFCIRLGQNRRLNEWTADVPVYLLDVARHLPAQGGRFMRLSARRGHAARTARLLVAWQPVTLRSPKNAPGEDTLSAWVVRTWEPCPPPGETPLEWILLTSVPVDTLDHALDRIAWYSARWAVEDYHSCLKTGCAIEAAQLQTAARLMRLLGFLSVIAVRMLQLRNLARSAPQQLAVTVVEPVMIQIMAYRTQTDPATMTVDAFFRAVAQGGGFLNRRADGPPGWKTLWHGWLRLLDWVEGVRLAHYLPPP